MEQREDQKWFQYYWDIAKEFGMETYKTWRWELLSSVVIVFFVAALTGNWKDFRTAFLATGLTLGCFAVWHILRAPWLLYKSANGVNGNPGTLDGMIGVVVIAALVIGGIELGRTGWNARPLGTIEAKTGAPPAPQITVQNPKVIVRDLPAPEPKKRCWLSNVAGMPNSKITGAVTANEAIIRCNYRIDAPYDVKLQFDREFIPGATVPVDSGTWSLGGTNAQGTFFVSRIVSPSLAANQLVVVTVYGRTDQYPRAVKAQIESVR